MRELAASSSHLRELDDDPDSLALTVLGLYLSFFCFLSSSLSIAQTCPSGGRSARPDSSRPTSTVPSGVRAHRTRIHLHLGRRYVRYLPCIPHRSLTYITMRCLFETSSFILQKSLVYNAGQTERDGHAVS